MPQLDTIYMSLIFLWTWLTLYLLVQKTKTVLITKLPKFPTNKNHKKPTTNLPWT